MLFLKQSKKEEKKLRSYIPELSPKETKFSFCMKALGKEKKYAIGSAIIVLLMEIAIFFGAYITKIIVDVASSPAPMVGSVQSWIYVYLGITVFLYIIGWRLYDFLSSHYQHYFSYTSDMLLFHYVAQHNPAFFFNNFSGAIATKFQNVRYGYKTIFDTLINNILGAVISICLSLYIFTHLHWGLSVLFVLTFMLTLGVYVYFGKQKRKYSKLNAEKKSKKQGILVDAISNMLTVSFFSKQKQEMKTLSHALYEELDAGRSAWRFTSLLNFLANFVLITFFACILLTVVHLWQTGKVTSGDFILVITIFQRMSGAIKDIGNALVNWNDSIGSIDEGLETLLQPHGIIDHPDAKKLLVSTGNIYFQHVHFAYEGKHEVFQDFELHIKPGEKIGLVGRSGAGKTTLISLLLRFHELQSGSIEIDGQDIAHITQKSLRENISIVPQEPLLFHRSILENIRYGDEKASMKAVKKAAQLAQAHEFIIKLPHGYNTKVGERGVKLSGGQRQRIAIARAILKNAPILILDEATASLDSESEIAISTALHNLVQGKTVIAIAHRLSTLREMSRIVVLENGKIIEDGSHDKLVQKNGLYAKLWDAQAGGFIKI